jgi:hypothetical protein
VSWPLVLYVRWASEKGSVISGLFNEGDAAVAVGAAKGPAERRRMA